MRYYRIFLTEDEMKLLDKALDTAQRAVSWDIAKEEINDLRELIKRQAEDKNQEEGF